MTPIERASLGFKTHFGAEPQYFFQAPGRVNLIAEHTDYNDGFVLPTAIDAATVVAASPREDGLIRVIAADLDEQESVFELGVQIPSDKHVLWSNYVRGVAQIMCARGYQIRGADLVIAGNVPQGVGLSSSASLEMAVGTALAHMSGLSISPTDLALIGQEAENEYVGCKCGIMDQLISAAGEEGHALLIDCRSLTTHAVSMPDNAAVVIIDSGVERQLVGSEYNERRSQCEEASRLLGVSALRDATLEDVEANQDVWDSVIYRRARHVVTENQRTQEAASALLEGNLARLSTLMADSHASLRDDFEVTVPAIDTLVEIVGDVIGERGGVRMTGGGFGGCVVALVPSELVSAVEEAVNTSYTKKTGNRSQIFVCLPSAGAGLVSYKA